MELILKDIINIMHNDYAGFKDKKDWDYPLQSLEKVKHLKKSHSLTRKEFVGIVKDYLLDFKDQHIFFTDHKDDSESNKKEDRGFRVRRYKERLYVSQVDTEYRLKTGMFFNSIGGYTIHELKQKHQRLLSENHAERENWMPVLSLYEYGEVEDSNGDTHVLTFDSYEKKTYIPTYSVEKVNDNTLLLTITDFMNPDAIATLIEKNQELLDTTENWIVDVRLNYGGSDSSFYLLLPYIMPVAGVELASQDDKMFFNCTSANAERVLEEIESGLENIQDEQALQFLKVFKREWQRNKGKGFVEFDFGSLLPDTFIKGNNIPEKIVVLSDYMCGSSGDSFVEICKKSNKVTVMGRPTMGLNDYANLATKTWADGFELMYPTSRLSRIDKGMGMSGKGIEPDVYIPWTPEHLDHDTDLKNALDYLSVDKQQ